MKTRFSSILVILSVLYVLATGTTQAQNIRMFYFAPTATMTANFTGATAAYIHADLCATNATGYSYVVLDNQTAPIFRNIAPPIIRQTYDSLTNVNSLMRRRLLQLRDLSNGVVNDIEMFLFDDRTELAATDTCKCFEIMSGKRGVWPCAGNQRTSAGTYIGSVLLGELGANHIINNAVGGWWAWYQTVVHEFSHTQFALEYNAAGVPVANKFGRDGVTISYGGDASHWGSEILGGQQSALDEGLATFWGLERNTAGRTALINWLNDKTERLHLGSHSVLTGTAEMWNAPHNVVFTGTIPANRVVTPAGWRPIRLVNRDIETGASYQLRSYKWLDVPGNYTLYNEKMFQSYALFFYENAMSSRTDAFAMMLRAAKKMTPPNNRLRYPAVFANALANEMEAFARTAAGRAAETNHTLVSSMFSYAMYDIVNHFGMTEADMQREFRVATGVPAPIAFTRYWAERAALKQRVCPFLGGPNCTGNGNIDFARAVAEAKAFCTDSSRILR